MESLPFLSVLLLLLQSPSTNAFCGVGCPSSLFAHPSRAAGASSSSPPVHCRYFALVYGPDGTVIREESSDSPLTDDNNGDLSKRQRHLLERVSSQIHPTTLIRIACAHAPPPHSNLHPSKVPSAQLLQLDATHMEIAVAVEAGNGARAQLLIPVPFPKPLDENDDITSTQGWEADVMSNVKELEARAQQGILQQEKGKDAHEERASQRRMVSTLQEEPAGDEYPDWWTYTELRMALAEEASTLKSLLNEDDFAGELAAMCQQNLVIETESKGPCKVVKACVAAAGPSGLFLRAHVMPQSETVEVAIQFQADAATADELRSRVLDLVESVEASSEETLVETENEDEFVEMTVAQQDLGASEEKTPEPETPAPLTEVKEIELEKVLVEDKLEATSSSDPVILEARKQPKSPKEEAGLSKKYASIDNLGERAFTILKDLYMI